MNDEVTQWIGKLKAGDEEAARQIWDRFFDRLQGLARRKLGAHPKRDCDAEDLALSAMNALCVGARENKFRQLDDREDLWQLLAMITSRKAAQAWRKKTRRKEVGESVFMDSSGEGGMEAVGAEAAQEEALGSLSETCQLLLGKLDDRLRQVAMLRLEGYSNQEIADQVGRSVKSVERYLQLIRQAWSEQESDLG